MPVAVLNPETVLPAPLAQALRTGREQLLRQRTARQAECAAAAHALAAAADLSWARLLAAADATLPESLLPYLQRERPRDFRGDTEAVALAATLPGLSPVLSLFCLACDTWRRWSFRGEPRHGVLDRDSLYAVVTWRTRDTPYEATDVHAGSLPLALALAEEAEHDRQRLPESPFADQPEKE